MAIGEILLTVIVTIYAVPVVCVLIYYGGRWILRNCFRKRRKQRFERLNEESDTELSTDKKHGATEMNITVSSLDDSKIVCLEKTEPNLDKKVNEIIKSQEDDEDCDREEDVKSSSIEQTQSLFTSSSASASELRQNYSEWKLPKRFEKRKQKFLSAKTQKEQPDLESSTSIADEFLERKRKLYG